MPRIMPGKITGLDRQRQVEAEGGSLADDTLDVDGTMVVADQFGDDGKTKSVAVVFRGEERLEDLLKIFG